MGDISNRVPAKNIRKKKMSNIKYEVRALMNSEKKIIYPSAATKKGVKIVKIQ